MTPQHPQLPGGTGDPFRHLVEHVRDYAIFFLDAEGRVLSWNEGAQRIKGYKPEEIIGRSFTVFYPAGEVARGWPQYELERARTEGRFEDEGWRVRKDGSSFWANVLITAIYGPDGTVQGFSKITRDLTERRRQEEALRLSEERFRLLVEGVTGYAIFLLDTAGRVASWNAGAERMTGFGADEIVGQPCARLFPVEDRERAPRDLALAAFEGRTEMEGTLVRRDGTRFRAAMVLTALYGSTGALRGYAKLVRDLTTSHRIEALEAAGRQMSEFLAILSHELRNPLAPIQNAVHSMHLKRIEDPELRWARDVIDRQVGHLARLVDDLLDVTRITTGKIRLNIEPLEIAVVVHRAVEASRLELEARGHTFEVTVPDTSLMIRGDLTRLTQVITNLLSNAAKFTPEGGRITLTASQDEHEAVVTVRDNGVGIPPGMLSRVFDLFAQGEQPMDRATGGLGIGLTLVKRLVQMHHGTIEARSEGPGYGSEFVIRLPVASHTLGTIEAPPRAPLGAATTRRILVVDDNRDSAESMAVLLEMVGHEVRTAIDGPAALAAAAAFRPHLVLLDIGLPGMTGYEVARRLREANGGEGMVIAAMTGYAQEDDKARALEAGFDHHLSKPVDLASLQSVIDELPDGTGEFDATSVRR